MHKHESVAKLQVLEVVVEIDLPEFPVGYTRIHTYPAEEGDTDKRSDEEVVNAAVDTVGVEANELVM